jgi:hypothetical protein
MASPLRSHVSVRARAAFQITGVTRDASGATLASCTVDLFRTSNDTKMATTTSDGSGVFTFSIGIADTSVNYYLVAYKAGSPDVFGTTANTLAVTQA